MKNYEAMTVNELQQEIIRIQLILYRKLMGDPLGCVSAETGKPYLSDEGRAGASLPITAPSP